MDRTQMRCVCGARGSIKRWLLLFAFSRQFCCWFFLFPFFLLLLLSFIVACDVCVSSFVTGVDCFLCVCLSLYTIFFYSHTRNQSVGWILYRITSDVCLWLVGVFLCCWRVMTAFERRKEVADCHRQTSIFLLASFFFFPHSFSVFLILTLALARLFVCRFKRICLFVWSTHVFGSLIWRRRWMGKTFLLIDLWLIIFCIWGIRCTLDMFLYGSMSGMGYG